MVVALPSAMEAVLSALAEHGTLYAAAASVSGAASFKGRGAAYRMQQPSGDWLVRHYWRGGAAAHVLRDEYLRVGEPRPLRELRASAEVRARGVATPEVVAAITYPAGGMYRADMATRFIPDGIDLAELSLGGATVGPRAEVTGPRPAHDLATAWRDAGTLLRSAFAAGVEHADLNLRNILIAGARTPGRPPSGALLLDLDRAVIHDRELSDVASYAILERLHRSRRKLENEYGARVTAAELAAFSEGLAGND